MFFCLCVSVKLKVNLGEVDKIEFPSAGREPVNQGYMMLGDVYTLAISNMLILLSGQTNCFFSSLLGQLIVTLAGQLLVIFVVAAAPTLMLL